MSSFNVMAISYAAGCASIFFYLHQHHKAISFIAAAISCFAFCRFLVRSAHGRQSLLIAGGVSIPWLLWSCRLLFYHPQEALAAVIRGASIGLLACLLLTTVLLRQVKTVWYGRDGRITSESDWKDAGIAIAPGLAAFVAVVYTATLTTVVVESTKIWATSPQVEDRGFRRVTELQEQYRRADRAVLGLDRDAPSILNAFDLLIAQGSQANKGSDFSKELRSRKDRFAAVHAELISAMKAHDFTRSQELARQVKALLYEMPLRYPTILASKLFRPELLRPGQIPDQNIAIPQYLLIGVSDYVGNIEELASSSPSR